MVNHILFIPPSFRSHIVSMPCWHSKCQSFQRWHIKQTTFWGNHSPCYTTHLCQPILNQRNKDTPQNFTSLGIRLDKTFISHIPLLNFAGAALHVTPRICANPSWTYRPKIHHKTSDRKIFISHICFELCRNSSPCYTTHVSQPILNQRPKTHYKLQIRKCSSHTSVFWTLPEQMTPRMCANPEPMFQRYTTKPQTPRFSSHTSLFWTLPEQLSILHHACVCQPILNQSPKTHYELQSENCHLTHPCFELCRNNSEQMTPRMCANPEPMLQRYTTKPQTLRFSSHTSVLNFDGAAPHITPRMCANPSWTNVPRHTTNFNRKMLISHIPVLNFAGTALHITPRMCANPEPTLQRYTTKPQTLRFSSHTSLFWTLPEQLSMVTPSMWANPSWTNVPRHTTNFRSENVHLTHPCFELCRNNSEQMTPRMCANPEPTFQRYTTKPQTLRFSFHTSVLNFAGAALHVTPRMWANPSWTNVPRHTTNFRSKNLHLTHPCFDLSRNRWHLACVPTLNQCCKDTPQNLRPQDFHLTHPSFELCRSSSPFYTTHVCQPILNHCSKDTPQNLRPQDFHLTHPSFELCRSSSPYHTTHVCQPWTNVPKIHHKTSDPKIFISHIPVLNFAGTAPHFTPRMWANPSWTNLPSHTTNFRSENFHLTHLFFELCRNNPEQITPRMCANPSWTNVPKHTTNFRSDFCSSHTSLFWTLPQQLAMLHHACEPTHPEPTSQDTLQTSDPKICISHIRVLNFAGTTRNRLHHACAPTHPEPTSQNTLQTSDPIFFISHIPVLNFAPTACHVAPRMWANPSCTNVPRYNTNY